MLNDNSNQRKFDISTTHPEVQLFRTSVVVAAGRSQTGTVCVAISLSHASFDGREFREHRQTLGCGFRFREAEIEHSEEIERASASDEFS